MSSIQSSFHHKMGLFCPEENFIVSLEDTTLQSNTEIVSWMIALIHFQSLLIVILISQKRTENQSF